MPRESGGLSKSALRSSPGEARRNDGARPHTPLRADDELEKRLLQSVDDKTLEMVKRRRRSRRPVGRRWLVRRLLLAADLLGLTLAFALGAFVSAVDLSVATISFAVFVASLPVWVVGAKVFGLYDDDEARADHTTLDDLARIFLLVTIGAFVFAVIAGYTSHNMEQVLLFWIFGIVFVGNGRAAARVASRRTRTYVQNAVIVGAGDIGQLLARKLLQHPEYGINLVGFVDAAPKERRSDLRHLTVLGTPDELPQIVRMLGIERAIFAFSRAAFDENLELIQSLRHSEVQVDIVPRLFEAIGPKVGVHTLEGLPLIGLPPVVLAPSSRLVKRSLDVLGASIGLILVAPFLAVIAFLIRRESPGPAFFRQTRLGQEMQEFTILKFRTMKDGTADAGHRAALDAVMDSQAAKGNNGLYKPDREEAVTRVGAWLRKTSLDELPQLVNVLRGEMSLVGPRPSLPYETRHFAPRHFERFHVPPGITGLWQVTARAHSTWLEALDMDVAYVRGWSIGLDIWLICRTPLQMLRLKTR
jgi:exopolysaccharide biosynthesis polyprenyl glycosylphosphotransferase